MKSTTEPDNFASKSMSEASRKTVLVLGARGRLGRAAVTAFANAGWKVLAQSRIKKGQNSASKAAEAQHPNVQSVMVDALDTQALLRQLPKVDVIVHALNPDYSKWECLLPPMTEAVIQIAKATDALLMVPGNVYNFGKDLPEFLDEQTPFVPNTPKAQLRIAMEYRLQQSCHEGMRCVVIRAGDFVGGSDTWLDLAIAKSLAKGQITQMGRTDLAHAWAYLPDLAKVFVRVAERSAHLPSYEVLHYTGHNITGAELQRSLENLMGKSLQVRQMPWLLMRALGLFVPIIGAVVAMRYLWQRPHQLRSTRLEKLIGPLTPTPLDTVLQTYVPTDVVKQVSTEISHSA